MSNSIPAANRTRRFQFHLSYLLYLLTLAALGFAVLRHVFEAGGGWEFNTLMSATVATLIAYFAFRFPILVRRLMHHERE